MGQYADELGVRKSSRLLLNVDGVAGSGKTFTFLKTFNILGKSLHSLPRLPVKGKKVDLSLATVQSLQSLFGHCRFLVVDAKSTINTKTLSLINDRI